MTARVRVVRWDAPDAGVSQRIGVSHRPSPPRAKAERLSPVPLCATRPHMGVVGVAIHVGLLRPCQWKLSGGTGGSTKPERWAVGCSGLLWRQVCNLPVFLGKLQTC